jgi:hypothetical protein
VQSTDDLICAALRGDRTPFRDIADDAQLKLLLDRINTEGVGPLLLSTAQASQWPDRIRQPIREDAVRHAMWELKHQQVLAETLAALDTAGVHPVLIKGTALAYSAYADPVQRTRADTDMLVSAQAKDPACEILASLDYKRSIEVSGDYVSYQGNFTKALEDGSTHTIDLHWKINNSEVLSRLFHYDELWNDSEPLPRLCAHARGASRVHALLLACMHRASHKHNPYYTSGVPHDDAPNRLLWLYDIHLLSTQLSPREWDEFERLAHKKGLRAVCLDGMKNTQARFRTVFPEGVLEALGNPAKPERPAVYLGSGKLRQRWMDFRAVESLAGQARLLRELFFPPAAYMRSRYSSPSGSLSLLYLRRAAGGVLKAVTGKQLAL